MKVATDKGTSSSENQNLVATLGFIPLANHSGCCVYQRKRHDCGCVYTETFEASDNDLQDYLDETCQILTGILQVRTR